MRTTILATMILSVGLGFTGTTTYGQAVSFGTWLEEGTGSVTGSGDSFTASPTASGIADNGDNFGERNAARHRVYQLFGQAIDFSSAGDEIFVDFDVTFNGVPENLDTGFRMSLVDTSTNQGFYAVGFDAGARTGTYNRVRFVDNLDGVTGDAHGGEFFSAINGSGTIAQISDPPTVSNGATEAFLTDGNTVSFSVVFTRNGDDSFSFTTNATEQNGDVVYPETAGSYNPVNPTSGDTSVANIAINSFDGIVFGLFIDDPFPSSPGGSYTVSNIQVTDGAVLLGDVSRNGTVDFLDISPFIGLLSNSEFQVEADINEDDAVDFLDISPFIFLLSN